MAEPSQWGASYLSAYFGYLGLTVSPAAENKSPEGKEESVNDSVENRVIQKFRERLASGDLARLRVIHRIAGGASGNRIEEKMVISGQKKATVRSMTTGASRHNGSSKLSEAEVPSLSGEVSRGLDGLCPAQKRDHYGIPLVGSITIHLLDAGCKVK